MPTRKNIRPDEKLPLNLTAAERKLVLEALACLDQEIEQIVRDTPSGEPVRMTLDDLDDFGGHVAAEANHCQDKSKAKKLDAIFEKIQDLLDTFTDEEPPQTVKFEDARKEKLISDQGAQIAQFASQALVAAEQLGIKNKALNGFCLAPAQREVLSLVPGITKALKTKLAQDGSTFSVGEVASMTLALAEDLPDGDARKQVAVLFLAKHLMDQLQTGIAAEATPMLTKKPKSEGKIPKNTLFQFKITLLGSQPSIWRRIQVADGTLDKLHEHIQTAMGWTNSHLHHFQIGQQLYGDPLLMEENMEEMNYKDSTRTKISKIVPKNGKRFSFTYEYDFGDSWEHEILFEGYPSKAPGTKYPLCLEGERACPPEDVGGIGGFYEFLAALADPKHEQHDDFMEWGGDFDADKFDAREATKAMKEGLPDWRSMDEDDATFGL